jgi:hypothetical protein
MRPLLRTPPAGRSHERMCKQLGTLDFRPFGRPGTSGAMRRIGPFDPETLCEC